MKPRWGEGTQGGESEPALYGSNIHWKTYVGQVLCICHAVFEPNTRKVSEVLSESGNLHGFEVHSAYAVTNK